MPREVEEIEVSFNVYPPSGRCVKVLNLVLLFWVLGIGIGCFVESCSSCGRFFMSSKSMEIHIRINGKIISESESESKSS